eukprot:5735772-Lingulodinium_polyedra.AAC.1
MADICQAAGWPPLPTAGPRHQPVVRAFVCYDCGASFSSPAGWHLRRRRQHGIGHAAYSLRGI